MLKSKKLLGASIAAAIAFGGAASQAMAEDGLSASVAVSNMYLWRGIDLGDASAAVSGELRYTESGFYTGIWGSSGDSGSGQEIDFFAGYGTSFGDFTVDASIWTYYYPSGPYGDVEDDVSNIYDDFGGLSEIILTLGYGPVSFSYYDNIAGGEGYHYYTLSVDFLEQFSATVGHADFDEESGGVDSSYDYTHLTLGYAFNDNLSFTLSKVLDRNADVGGFDEGDISLLSGESKNDVLKALTGGADSDLLFQVTYSIPLN